MVLIALSSPKEWCCIGTSDQGAVGSLSLEVFHSHEDVTLGDVVSGYGGDGPALDLVTSEVVSNLYDSIRASSRRPTRYSGQRCLQCWTLGMVRWAGWVPEQLCPSLPCAPSCSSTCQSPPAPQCSCLAGSCAWPSLQCVSCSEGEKCVLSCTCLLE